jgi:type IV secretion system protein VirB9
MKFAHAALAATTLVVFVAVCIARADPLIDDLLGGHEPTLSEEDQRVLAGLEKNRPGGGLPAVQPVFGQDGAIHFLYGAQDPGLVCAPLQICDVALQEGEEVKYINIGDEVRWSVEPTYTGTAPHETPHLFVKPKDVGLETSLAVSTNRRTYHFRLTSHSKKYMPKVVFSYPEDVNAKLTLLRIQRQRDEQQETKAVQRSTTPAGTNIDDLVFDYAIEGRAPWKPVRAYNDGVRTVIEMPEAVEHTEAPSLLVLRTPGSLFSSDELTMVNYRLAPAERDARGRLVARPRFIVDSVFDRAVLLAGVGSNQLRVNITRLPPTE